MIPPLVSLILNIQMILFKNDCVRAMADFRAQFVQVRFRIG